MKIKIKSLIISTSFLLVLFCFASADSIQISSLDDILTIIDGNFNSTQLSSITSAYENNQYYLFMNYGGKKFMYFFNDLNLCPSNFGLTVGSVSYGDSGYYRQTALELGNYNFTCFYYNGSSWYAYSANSFSLQSTKSGYYLYSTNLIIPSGFSRASNDSPFYSNDSHALDHIYRNFTGKLAYYNYSSNSSSFIDIQANTYSSVYDDRLLVSKSFDSAGNELLNIDFSKFFTYSPAAIREPRNINITLECDGVNQNFVLDSTSSEIISIYRSNNIRYVYITPYSFFDIDSYDSIILKKVAFDDFSSSPGGSGIVNSYNIICDFVMKNVTNDIVPDDIPAPDYEDPEVVNQTIINNMQSELHEYSSRYSFLNGTWNFIPEADLPSIASWATVYENYVWFGDVNSDTTYQGHWFQMANNIPSIADLSRPFDPAEFIENNKMWSYYDVIKIKVFSVNAQGQAIPFIDSYNLAGYLVLFSDRYYDHYIAENQVNIIKILQYDAENNILYFNYMKNKLDDFENKSLVGFNTLIDLNKSSNIWLATINGSVSNLESSVKSAGADIISAINNINIPETPDLSTITDSLEYLFIPSFSWSTINYNEYLDSLGILSMPFRFGSSVFSGLENGYSPNLEYHLYEASVPLPASLGVSGNSFKLWNDQDFTLVTASIVPDQDLLANIRLFNLIVCIMSQAFLTYLHIFRREGGVEDGI